MLRGLGRANTHRVTTPAPAIEGASAAQDAARDWQAVHADPSIQFAPIPAKPPSGEVPGWLRSLGEFLEAVFGPIGRALGMSWPVMQWVLIGLAVLLVLYGLWRMLEPWLERRRLHSSADAGEPAAWAPSKDQALALLDEADRLAGEGRYDEATHLLLLRSVQQIAAARPDWVQRASTAREIAALPHLPEGARSAFSLISTRVERSLFALRELGAEDWQAARQAYADFALQRIAA